MASPHHPQSFRDPAVMRTMRYEETHDPEPPEAFIMGMNIVNVITHLLLGAIAFYAILSANAMIYFLPTLSAHIYLSVIGYILLMSQAAILFNPYTWWMSNNKPPTKTIVYWVIQIAGATMTVAGAILGFVGTATKLTSVHGITGIIALVLTILSLLVAGLHTRTCSSDDCTGKKLLAVLVTVTLIIAFASLCLAFNYGKNDIDNSSVNLAISFSVFALIGTLILTFGDMIRKSLS